MEKVKTEGRLKGEREVLSGANGHFPSILEDKPELLDFLQDYYGKQLKTKVDLKEKACCSPQTRKEYAEIFKSIPEEVKSKHYGCGVPIPKDNLRGLKVLDLGSGAGVDVFILSRLVGEEGFVYGIDMTDEQIDVARRHTPAVMQNFGYKKTNVAFQRDYVEVARSIPSQSIDLVISNCVINLSPKKEEVFKTIHRVLKSGGEFYISDITSDRRVPGRFKSDPVLVAECLGGAEYINDWFDQMTDAGFRDPRIVERSLVQNELRGEPLRFWSVTVRGFKFDQPLDRRCEDFGQLATYKGNLAGSPARFRLDDHHLFEAHKPSPVCRNTARMLTDTRLYGYFDVTDPIRHFGLFPCGPRVEGPEDKIEKASSGSEGCC